MTITTTIRITTVTIITTTITMRLAITTMIATMTIPIMLTVTIIMPNNKNNTNLAAEMVASGNTCHEQLELRVKEAHVVSCLFIICLFVCCRWLVVVGCC